MADDRYVGIKFPFQEDTKGKFLSLSKTTKEAIKNNLTFLLTTPKRSRLYKPQFGTNFLQYIYEPVDEKTYAAIRNEIEDAVAQNFDNIQIENVEVSVDRSGYMVAFKIQFVYTEGVLRERDIIDVVL